MQYVSPIDLSISVILQNSVSDKKSYALSVRDWDESKKDIAIKHYRIRKMDDGRVYISPKRTFASLIDLVEHYRSKNLLYEQINNFKHFKICLFPIFQELYFSVTESIFWYHLGNIDGLCSQLTKVCPKEPEVVPFKEIEVDRSSIRLVRKLGHGNFGDVYAGVAILIVMLFN